MGKPVMDQDKFTFLELGNKKIVRVNIIANIVEKYDSGGEKKYTFFKVDDGTGQISLKVFGDDVQKFKNVVQGLTVAIIGTLRHWNEETYINPEIIKEADPKYLLIRKLETEKEREKNADPLERDQIIAVKDKILATIKNSEEEGGIDMDKVIMHLQDISPTIINQEVQKLLEEGIVFEPRPGKVRYLG